jgi:GNAT superfamily N-acetyltransferase
MPVGDSVTIREGLDVGAEDLVALYEELGWRAYSRDPEGLARGLRNSTWAASAWDADALVGLIRVLSDEVAIAHVQDLLVSPAYQRKGIGSALMEACLRRFDQVRTISLLTDDEPRQHAFYQSVGFTNTRDCPPPGLNAYVRLRDRRFDN